MRDEGNPRGVRSARRSDLTRLRESGRATRRGPLLVRYAPGGDELLSAFAIPAKGTTAVARNRLRRQLREVLREVERETGLTGTVLVSAAAAEPQAYADLVRAARSALGKLTR